MTPDEKIHALPEHFQRVYEAIYRAAYLGEACPSNADLACIGGVSSYPRWGTDAIAYLERAGLLTVVRGQMTRVVVLASGQATAGRIAVGRAVTMRTHSEPPIVPGARERFSCSFCGVRSDYGCKHTRQAA
jgi:hypothetical protein